MNPFRLLIYVLLSMLGLNKPSPQSPADIQKFLTKQHADLSTAFMIDSIAFHQMAQASFILPQLKIYDGSGVQLYEATGYHNGFADTVRSILEDAMPQEGRPHLSDELLKYCTFEGDSVELEDLPVASYYFVEYWATWCIPCKYQMKDIHAFKKAMDSEEIIVITVNCDFRESWVREHEL